MSNNGKEFTFFWFIENYSHSWQKTEEPLDSPEFSADGLEGTAWTLKLYPTGNTDPHEICICLYRNEDNGPDIIDMNYSLSLIKKNGSSCTPKTFSADFAKKCGRGCVFRFKVLPQLMAKHITVDTMIVRCKLWNMKGNPEKVAPICARTRLGIEHISFLYEVEDFSAVEPNLKPVQIQSRTNKGCTISSSLNFIDDKSGNKNVVLEITPSDINHILAKCEIYLLDSSGNMIKSTDVDYRFEKVRKETQTLTLSLTKNEILNRKDKYLINDNLSLLCDCIFSTGIEFQQVEGTQCKTNTTYKNLVSNNSYVNGANISTEKLEICPNVADDLKVIYSSKFLADVELKTKTNSFPAHKIVLCARSPVFKVMMSNDMREKISGSIPMDDFDDDVVQQLLLFLYTDKTEDLQWETAIKLYYVADKYQIEKLRLVCSSFLIDNINVPTAPELLLLAYTYSDSDLQNVVENFILEHDEQVFCSSEWEKIMDTNPQLAMNTMHLRYKTKTWYVSQFLWKILSRVLQI